MKRIIILAGICFSLLFFSNRSQALVPIQPINPGISDAFAKYVKWRCETIPEKFDDQKSKLDEKKEDHLKVFNSLSDKLSSLIIKLGSKGYDTDELIKDQKELDEMIEKYSSDYDILETKIKDSKEYACKKTDAQFKAKLEEARAALKQVKKDAHDILKFYKNEIREDILDLSK